MSPWQNLDPNMRQTTEGARDGVGAELVWSGNDKVGSGTQLITASTPDRSVASDIDFGKMGWRSPPSPSPRKAPRPASLGRSISTWVPAPSVHYFGLVMDRMIGKDYEKGLSKTENAGRKDCRMSTSPVSLRSRRN